METPETASSPVENGRPTTGLGGLGVVDTGSTEEQRAAWRAKKKLQRARKKAATPGGPGLAPDGDPLSAVAPGASAVLPGSVPAPAIPWDPLRLKKHWELIVPEAERWDVAKLKAKAEAVDPCLVDLVEKDGPWNPVAKSTLIESGPQVTADALNAIGIGAERADLVAFVAAAWSIFQGRAILADKLDAMLKEKQEREERGRTHAQEKEAA